MKYFINYHTGAGNEWVECNLDKAKRIADDGSCYTQQSISIEDEEGNEVSRREWWGISFDTAYEMGDVIIFGEFGYYGEWIDI